MKSPLRIVHNSISPRDRFIDERATILLREWQERDRLKAQKKKVKPRA